MMWRGADAAWTQKSVKLQTSMGAVFSRLGGIIAEQKKYVWYASITIIVSSALQMIPPVATKYVIDRAGLEPQIPFYCQAEGAAHTCQFAQQRIPPLLFESDHEAEKEPVAVFLFCSLGNVPGE